ncbi:hypothetical protein SRHO_G00249380 [Serrasalmus rhombeus]
MDHSILLIMVLIGSCDSTCGTNQYHFIHKAKSFADAQLYCRNTYSNLATINNMEDMKNLLATVTDGYLGAAWIGLYQQSTPGWHWSLSMPDFYDEGEVEYRNWFPGEPNNAGGIEDCGVMDANSQFMDIPCTLLRPFICYDAQSTQKYIMIRSAKTWLGAQSYCRLNHTDLVSVRNIEENLQIQKLLMANDRAFIGLFKDNFTWSDNSSLSFRYWASGHPMKVNASDCCVGLYVTQGKWVCGKCTLAVPFFCYTKKKKQILQLEVQSGQNVNDPAVKAAILEKIQQKVKDHWMAERTTLTWRLKPDGNIFHKKKLSIYTSNNCG